MNCPVCGAELPNGALYCENCHTRFASPINAIPPTANVSYRCNRCGRRFPSSQGVPSFCPDCGNALTAGRPQQSDKKWTPGHFIALGGLLLTFIGTFCPFFTISILGFSRNVVLWDSNMRTDAYILSALLAITLLLWIFLTKGIGGCMIISGALSVGFAIAEFFFNRNKLTDVDGGDFWGTMDLSGMLNPGIGFYLIVIGGAAVIVSGFLLMHEQKTA